MVRLARLFVRDQQPVAQLLSLNWTGGEMADESVAFSGWRDISSAPTDGKTPVLTCDGTGRMHVARHFGGKHWYYAVSKSGSGIVYDPTHWMPLPSPPEPPK